MDFIDFSRPTHKRSDTAREAEQDAQTEQDSTLNVASAGLAAINPLSARIRYGEEKEFYPQKGYNPFQDEDLSNYNPDDFVESYSPQQTKAVKKRIDQQRYDREMLSRHPVAAIAAGVVGTVGNPVLAPALLAAPISIPGVIALEMGAEAVSEVLMHKQMPERTKTESVINVGSAGAFAGIVGGIARSMQPNDMQVASEAVAREINQSHSASAMEVPKTTLKQESMKPAPFNKLAGWSVGGDVIKNSQSPTARRLMQQIGDISYRLNKHEEGIPSPVPAQTAAMRADKDILSVDNAFNSEYAAYRKAGGTEDFETFKVYVTNALENGDFHDIPQVQTLARTLRELYSSEADTAVTNALYGQKALNEYHAKADTGIRPSDVLKNKNEVSYAPRLYSKVQLAKPAVQVALKSLLKSKIVAALTEESPTVVMKTEVDDIVSYSVVNRSEVEEILSTDPNAQALQSGKRNDASIMSQADDVANSIMRNMYAGSPISEASMEFIVPKAGALNKRSLDFVSNKELRDAGVLVGDAQEVFNISHKQMVRDNSWAKAVGSKSVPLEDIRQDYSDLVASGKMTLEDAAIREGRDINALQIARDRFYGTRGMPADATALATQATEYVSTWNTISLLGSAALPNLVDMMTPILRHGLTPVAGTLAKMMTGSYKQGKLAAQQYGLAGEAVLGRMVRERFEVAGNAKLPFGKDTNDVNKFFGKWSGLNFVGDVSQTSAALTAVTQIGKMSKRYTGKDIAKLAEVGIDEGYAKLIAKELAEHSTSKHRILMANTDKWTDRNAVYVFENAVRRDALRGTMFSDVTDKPKWADSNNVGKLASQFQSFNMMATQRMLVAGWQRADAEFFSGVMTMMVLGWAIDAGRSTLRGEDITERNAVDNLVAAMDRSGSFGYVGIGAAAAFATATGQKQGRFIERAPWSVAMGPMVENPYRTIRAGMKMSDGEFTEDEAYRFARGLPITGWWHITDTVRMLDQGHGYKDK